MVVDDFNVSGAGTSPSKTDTPLVIDSHAELTCPVALERFQPVAWNGAQIRQRRGGVEMIQFPLRDGSNRVVLAAEFTPEHLFGVPIPEGLDHFVDGTTVSRYTQGGIEIDTSWVDLDESTWVASSAVGSRLKVDIVATWCGSATPRRRN